MTELYINKLKKVYDKVCFPVCFVDQSLKVFYANRSARICYPLLTEKNALAELIPPVFKREIAKKLEGDAPFAFSLDEIKVLSGADKIIFTPMTENGKFVCARVQTDSRVDMTNLYQLNNRNTVYSLTESALSELAEARVSLIALKKLSEKKSPTMNSLQEKISENIIAMERSMRAICGFAELGMSFAPAGEIPPRKNRFSEFILTGKYTEKISGEITSLDSISCDPDSAAFLITLLAGKISFLTGKTKPRFDIFVSKENRTLTLSLRAPFLALVSKDDFLSPLFDTTKAPGFLDFIDECNARILFVEREEPFISISFPAIPEDTSATTYLHNNAESVEEKSSEILEGFSVLDIIE